MAHTEKKKKKKEKLKGGGKFLVVDSAWSGTLHSPNIRAKGRETLVRRVVTAKAGLHQPPAHTFP